MSTNPQQALAHAIRFLSIDAIVKAQEGHLGVSLGMAEIATALYTRHIKFNPAVPQWFDRDRVVLSNGHGSLLLYALLHLTGYADFPIEEIQRFRELGSHCEGHPERNPAIGIEVTTGLLGQDIANALCMANAEAWRLLKISHTAQPGTRGNVVLALPRSRGGWGFGRDLFHTLPRTSP
jgi:transketolase